MKQSLTVLALAATLAACSTAKHTAPAPVAAAPAPQPLSGVLDEQILTASATIQKIDAKTRRVTLKRPDGTTFSIVAGPEVRNFDQLKRGDVVTMTYKESIAYDVKKAGAPGVSASTDVSRSQPGQKPGASVTDTVTVRMTITAINKKRGEATLLGPEGNSEVVQVQDTSKLDQVQVGDVVDLTYTENLAIAVEKAAK